MKSAFNIFMALITIEICAVNIAKRGEVTFCGKVKLNQLTDGDRTTPVNIEAINQDCNDRSFVSLMINESHIIDFVKVYTGKSDTKGRPHPLDYFEVELRETQNVVLCGIFPKPIRATVPGEEMRVNCDSSARLHSWILDGPGTTEIRLYMKGQKNVRLTEMEVFSLGVGFPNHARLIYRGCFMRFSGTPTIFKDVNSCWRECIDGGGYILAVKGNRLCYCGNEEHFKGETKKSKCDIVCNDAECEGADYFSVYYANAVLPTYQGCTDDPAPEMTRVTNGTITGCLRSCENYSHIWLQRETCACLTPDPDEEFFNYIDTRQCNLTCPGDGRAFCGGHDVASIYKTCFDSKNLKLPCSEVLRCAQGYDEHGRCLGGCMKGYDGEYCIRRAVGFEEIGGSIKKQANHALFALIIANLILSCNYQIY